MYLQVRGTKFSTVHKKSTGRSTVGGDGVLAEFFADLTNVNRYNLVNNAQLLKKKFFKLMVVTLSSPLAELQLQLQR